MTNPATQELVKRLKNGDVTAFDAVFMKYYKKVYFFARDLIKSHEEAETLVQDVFTKIWEKRETLEEDLSFESFIYTITYRTTISLVRKKIVEKKSMEEYFNRHDNDIQTLFDEIAHHDYKQLAQKYIDKLPPRRKQVYLMSRGEGLTHKEIADKLGISVNSVKNHMVAALNYLRSNIEDFLSS